MTYDYKEMLVTLYRGIAVESDRVQDVISRIKGLGLHGNEGTFHWYGWDLRRSIGELYRKPQLSTTDTRGGFREFPVVAFADEIGAHFYALRHNYRKGRVPLVIKAVIDISRKYTYVDGRDFLYSVFQGWDQKNLVKEHGTHGARNFVVQLLERIYGKQIIRYFERAAANTERSHRIAMCDLAVHDMDVVRAHLRNRIVIGGRYGVVFRSAFFVEAPIAPEEIADVFVPKAGKYVFNPDVNIYEWL